MISSSWSLLRRHRDLNLKLINGGMGNMRCRRGFASVDPLTKPSTAAPTTSITLDDAIKRMSEEITSLNWRVATEVKELHKQIANTNTFLSQYILRLATGGLVGVALGGIFLYDEYKEIRKDNKELAAKMDKDNKELAAKIDKMEADISTIKKKLEV